MDEIPTIIIDPGAREWRAGYAYDEGPGECPPGPPTDDHSKWLEQLTAVLAALEAEPAEQKALVAERPGTLDAERESVIKALFVDHGVQAVCIAAAPKLALFNINRDTCVIVDVGELSTTIFCVFEGHAVFDAATIHPLAGRHLPAFSSDASCEGLFNPSRLDSGDDSQVERASVGVHEAILSTIALTDTTLRRELLENIVLIGGGSRLADFPQRMEREVSSIGFKPRKRRSAAACLTLGNPAHGLP